MNTKYNIGDKVLIEATVKAIRAYENQGIEYYLEAQEFSASVEEKAIHGLSKETSLFRKEYRKAEKESKEKYYVTEHFKMELRDVIYRKGEPACVMSKTLGLPGDCITKIITGYTKKMTKERHDWICEALAIDPEV